MTAVLVALREELHRVRQQVAALERSEHPLAATRTRTTTSNSRLNGDARRSWRRACDPRSRGAVEMLLCMKLEHPAGGGERIGRVLVRECYRDGCIRIEPGANAAEDSTSSSGRRPFPASAAAT